ncbi:MAG: hypothetical protein CM15mV4_0140 [Caudoviricetes sp.]|nr:MAG: hypothetical protein CM15mV4_0140 [Caudoviricetes sp.]
MYQPEVNDYVKWKVKLGQDLEGWVISNQVTISRLKYQLNLDHNVI